MKIKYRQILLLIMSLILLFLTACSQQSTKTENSQVQDKGTLKLYIYEAVTSNTKLFNAAIDKFSTSNPEVQFEKVSFKDIDEYTKKVSAELMSGEGPDVLLFQSYMDLSLRKIMDMGVLADLNEFINDDPEFKINEFNKVVMDCGLYQGKRYLMPLFFSVNAFLTTEELLLKNDFHIDLEHWTLKDLAEQLRKLNNINLNRKRVYFNWSGITITDLIYSNAQQFIDYEKHKVHVDTLEFIELLNTYKTIHGMQLPNDIFLEYNRNMYNIMKDNQLLVGYSSDLLNPGWLWRESNYINYYLDTEVKLYPFPTGNGSHKYAAVPEILIAMNQQCHSKKLAFNFIKTFFSEDLQSSEIMMGVPVNQTAYEKLLEKYSGEQGSGRELQYGGMADKFRSVSLTPALVGELRHILSNITTCEIPDNIAGGMVWEETSKFLDGKCTAEETAKAIQNKVQLYLNE